MTNPYKDNFNNRTLKQMKWYLTGSIAVLFLIPACYTLLKHPTVLREDYTTVQTNRCSDCHDQSDLWDFHHPKVPYYKRTGHYNRWSYYYDIPWWYDSFWYYDDQLNPETVPLNPRSVRPEASKGSTSTIRGSYIRPPVIEKQGTSDQKVKMKKKDENTDEEKKKDQNNQRSVKPSKKKKKKDN